VGVVVMMDPFSGLLYGFSVALQPQNLFFCFLGTFVGTLIGVLPGIGPGGTIALLLTATYFLNPATSIIMLAGIYYGAMYGGSTTSILVNIPGEAASVVTCLDGYQMARKGRAGAALGISAIGSFVAGTFGVVGLMLLAPPLASVSLRFSSPEYVNIVILGLTMLVYLSFGSRLKAVMMAVVGLLIGTVGLDSINGVERFTFGNVDLLDGIGLVPVAMGLFGISEVLLNLEQSENRSVMQGIVGNILPTLKDLSVSLLPILRGTFVGFGIGIIPGGNATIASLISYATERKFSKRPEMFGKGAIEGVAGPESANNSASIGSFVPLLTLGIPTNAVMALLLGALMIHGVIPGPLLIKQNPDIFWGTIASMYVGNAMLLALNLPLIGIWVKVLKTPYSILYPIILLFCLIGAYAISNTIYDVIIMLGFGVLGFLMRKFNYEPAPLIMAFVLGPMLEDHVRRSLILSSGSFWVFFNRPIAGAFLVGAVLVILSGVVPAVMKKARKQPKFVDRAE
jgi:putative tricarboxylic transport membrane protein